MIKYKMRGIPTPGDPYGVQDPTQTPTYVPGKIIRDNGDTTYDIIIQTEFGERAEIQNVSEGTAVGEFRTQSKIQKGSIENLKPRLAALLNDPDQVVSTAAKAMAALLREQNVSTAVSQLISLAENTNISNHLRSQAIIMLGMLLYQEKENL